MEWFLVSLRKAHLGRWCPCRKVKRDAKIWLTILKVERLPILLPMSNPPLERMVTYSDAVGEILDTPGVGLLIPAQLGCKPRVAAWDFPTEFLDCVDEEAKK